VGEGLRISLQSSIHIKGHPGKKRKRESNVSSALLKEKKKERRSRKMGTPF
jgi:hypothetical protein